MNEIIFISILSALFGVVWWAFDFIFNIVAPFLSLIGADSLLSGVWLTSGIFFAYCVRKPFSGFYGELISSTVQGFVSNWGFLSVIYGIVQGLATELVFYSFSYKRWDMYSTVIASVVSMLVSYSMTFFIYQYYKFAPIFIITELITSIISAVFISGICMKKLADNLFKTGLLEQQNNSY